ncbi:hypothetical protein DFH06DRAFT_1305995 [Mycena polygramma]|nr:hypothetical protein DFH06DRAFT_1308715 [Mycena polygramma]KAJ7620772.1 hypothetical protein DFH06DRAFT_1305995 [Mycena polygramma]
MPPQSSATQIRLNNITKCLDITASSLEVLSSGLREPSLESISYTTRSLLKNVETIKGNKDTCIQLLEHTHELLNAILVTHIKSDTGAELPPSVLGHIGKFTETLHKIHTFIEAQQKGNKIKRLFKQGELAALLKNCKEDLQEGLDCFEIDMSKLMTDITVIQKESRDRHQEVLHLIETLSETGSDRNSVISRVYSGFHNSSTSISMLPSNPKFFHGRDCELVEILQLFSLGVPRVAILGAGGMGKTTLARAVLHHAQITARYEQHRYFVACDSATAKIDLAALIGAHLGLKPGKDLTGAIVQHFSSNTSCLLILDNVETAWEPMQSREEVEEFFSLLTDVKHLALIITMRGAERPGKVAWTRPFLRPLSPLDRDAARQTLIDIADDIHSPEEVDEVLALTDNMPLAISLLAHVVDSEGCSRVLSRWQEEKTSVISDGWDRKSNLDLSIALSLSSPRLRSFPDSHKLLSLLSMLPNGLSEVELVQSKLTINNVLGCKAVLISTGLAYSDSHKRLKVLVPIRECVQKSQPPKDDLIRPLRTYFQQLLQLEREYSGKSSLSGTVARISSNLANIQNVLQRGLCQGHPDLVDSVYCTFNLYRFSYSTGQGDIITLMKQIPNVLSTLKDHQLKAHFSIEVLSSWLVYPFIELETLVSQALMHFEHVDVKLQCRFYISLGFIYSIKNDLSAALNCAQTALSLALPAEHSREHSQALYQMAWINWRFGYYSAGQAYAKECQRVAKISADLWKEAQGLSIEASCSTSLGNYNQSLLLCHRGQDLLAACGLRHSPSNRNILITQAEVHKSKSDFTEAHSIQHQILQETKDNQDIWNYSFALLNIADISVSMNVPKEVVHQNITAARRIFNSTSHSQRLLQSDIVLADLALREGDMLEARSCFVKSIKSSLGSNTEIVSYCLERLGDARRWDYCAETWSWATILLVHALNFKVKLLVYKALLFLGQIFHNQADEHTAMSLFNVALQGFTYMDVHRSRGECMLHLGDILKGHGDLLKAVELWDTARPLFERSLQGRQVKMIDERLASVGNDELERHRKSLVLLAELKAPPAMIQKEEDDVSDIEDFWEVDDEKDGRVLVA